MRKLVAVFAAFCGFTAAGQTGDAAGSLKKTDSLFATYYVAGHESFAPLYNGRQFYGYPSSIEGHAFHATKEWSSGSVQYDGIWYRNVLLMYDIHRDELIVKHPNGIPVILLTDRVQQFNFQGQNFVNLKNQGDSSRGGFFQELTRGDATLYAKRVKRLDEKIDGTVLERKFLPADVFYILKDGSFHLVKNQNALFNILKEKRQAVQQFRRQINFKFKSDPEQFIYRITEHYNQINP